MVERIEKPSKADYWEVASTSETKEEKKREEKGHGQERRDSFGETSDFIQLLAKDPRKFKSEKIPSSQIKGLIYRGVTTHRDNALLEVDISMANGTLVKGAQVAVSRQEGMRYISRRAGEEMVVDQIVRGTFLTVAVPERGRSSPEVVSEAGKVSPPRAFRWDWYYFLGMGALLMAILLLIYIFWVL